MSNLDDIKESFINFIDEINRDYFLNIEIVGSGWEDEDDMDIWEFTTTNIDQARVVYLSLLFQSLHHHELYDRNLVLFINSLIPPYEVFDEIYDRFRELPDMHPDIKQLDDSKHLLWGFIVDND
jgi:hypothetical protein